MKNIQYLFLAMLLFAISQSGNSQALANFDLEITAPGSVAGDYKARKSTVFGALSCATDGLAGEIVLGDNAIDTKGCSESGGVTAPVDGKIALIDRGACTFIEKAFNAQAVGAIAVIICDSMASDTIIGIGASDEDLQTFDISIPVFAMTMEQCQTIRTEVDNGLTGTFRFIEGADLVPSFPDDAVVYEEDFTGGFNGWRSQSRLCNGQENTTAATWEYRENGDLSQGGFSGATDEAVTFNPCSGFVVFDSDKLDNGGDGNNQGGGPCPAINEAALLSPPIDLSNISDDAVIGLKFTQNYRYFDGEFFVGWSTDSGATWQEEEINTSAVTNDPTTLSIERFPLPGVNKGDQLLVRFRFQADYYFWVIDNVQLIEFTGTNIEMTSAFYTPASAVVPMSQANADTFFFSTNIRNTGAEDPGEIKLNVEIVDANDVDRVFYKDSTTISGLGVNELDTISLENTYVPEDLEPGLYAIFYQLTATEAEEDIITDNAQVNLFSITNNLYSKELTGPTNFFSFGVPWKVGNAYLTSPTASRYVADSVAFAVAYNGTSIQDNYVDVYLLEVLDPTYQSFDINDIDINGHPSFNITSFTTHVFSDEESGDVIAIPINEAGPVPIEPGKTYFLLLAFDDTQAGRAEQPNFAVLPAFNEEDFVYTFVSTVLSLDEAVGSNDARWFLGGVDENTSLVVRMTIKMETAADDEPLPEEAFILSPNPTSNDTYADLKFETPTDATLILADMNGRLLMSKDLRNVTSQRERIELSNYPTGTYFVRVSTLEGTKTRKLIVVE